MTPRRYFSRCCLFVFFCSTAVTQISAQPQEKSLKLSQKFSKYGKVCGFGLDQIKAKSIQSDPANDATVPDEPGKIVADVQSTKLKQMLAGIKQKG